MKLIPLIIATLFGVPVCCAQLDAPVFSPGGGPIVSPALIRISHPNAAGAIFYTLDGSDPRDPFGNVTASARRYQEPLSLNRSALIRARVKAGDLWSDLAGG